MSTNLVSLLSDLKEEEALKLAQDRLDGGDDPLAILDDAKKGLEIVGKRFEEGTYFIPDLVYSGEILQGISAIVKPRLTGAAGGEKIGKFILGTVAGDIHDIGKDIVSFMLDINGFEVHDLGVDVPAERFVEAIRETEAPLVGLSGFLTLAFDSMRETVEAIKRAGLRDKVKILIGGFPVNEEVRVYTGADAFGKDATQAVSLSKAYLGR
jgi:methanogenic corrinoid protein MtbC1